LEVRTREQLPQNWATTQNNLGTALRDQADRTEGPKGAELLAQAVSAYRMCRASVFRGNGAGSAAHYFVGTGAWGTEQSDKGRVFEFSRLNQEGQ
jgi:hypothetical protein